jgi:HlyD family secretion protein
LKQIESEYERVKELYEKGLASDAQLEETEANYLRNKGEYRAQKSTVTQAREAYNDALEELEKTTIHSPLNGTITKLNVDLGEKVLGSNFTQGTNIMTVSDLDNMEAIVEVDENDIVLISVNDTTRVEIDAFSDKKFLGIVTHVGNSAITENLGSQNEVVNFEVKVKLIDKDKQIRPGMSCTADIETETVKDVVSVPIQSVTARVLPKKNGNNGSEKDQSQTMRKRPEPEEVVFVVGEENRAKIVPVDIGISDDNFMQITSGLDAGTEVITGPYRAVSKELSDSAFVSVSKNGKPKFARNE